MMGLPSRYFFLVGFILEAWLMPSLQGFVLPSSPAVTFAADVSHPTFVPSSSSRGSSTRLGSTRSTRTTTSGGGGAASIVQIESHADWLELIEDFDDDGKDNDEPLRQHRITAVTFTASWCKFCQKFLRMWKRTVVEKQQKKKDSTTAVATAASAVGSSRVQFASVDYGSNRRLCKSLKIDALPTVQFYDHEGNLLYSFACGPKKFKTAKETLARYLEMTPQQIQQEAEKDAILRNQSAMAASSNNIDDSEDEEEEQEVEPAMFLRKRDRLKRKLLGKSSTGSRDKLMP